MRWYPSVWHVGTTHEVNPGEKWAVNDTFGVRTRRGGLLWWLGSLVAKCWLRLGDWIRYRGWGCARVVSVSGVMLTVVLEPKDE